ncbi:MAG: AAA family ATPase [Desulfobacula sp.]|nr:AAA family ATPase [Desulfobacula sp.]
MECPKCSFQNQEGIKFCGKCGYEINNNYKLEKEKRNAKSERKHVTIFFTDLSGYTAMTERLDPEDVRIILNHVFKKISEIIEKFDGFIERYIGDSVMAVFGIPKAHEDDPVRAINTAIEIHDAVKSISPWIQEKVGHQIFMHTGINTGLVVTGEVNLENGSHGLTGLNINIASRLESLSDDDEILVGPQTYKLAKNFFNFQALKPVNIKGKTGLLHVYKVLSKKNIEFGDNIRTFFSGRNEELSILYKLSNQLVHQDMGSTVFIIGDPGIGKSRLVNEYKKQFLDADILWIASRSSSYLQETSYGTFLEILKNYAGIKDSDDDVKGWDKLEEKLMHLFPGEVPETLPYLATLLSLKVKGNLFDKVRFIDGEALKSQIYRAFFILLKRLTYDRPLVLEFEDFHWADQSTVDLLEHLLPIVCELPLLILFISRNAKNRPASKLRKFLKNVHNEYHTEISLNPLSKENILDLASKNLNLDPISSQLRGLIHRKCEGNPLYLEALLWTLNHNDLIIKNETTGQYTIKPLSGKVPIPDTLRGIVASTIDRLDEDMKGLLRIASVIGRNFLYRLLEAIGDTSKSLDNNLSILIGENLIKKKVENPELEYYFYHDLIRDVAYDTILLQHREKLHRSVGEAIESVFSDQIERFYGLLSYHFAKAAQWNKAQKYLIKAGDQANRIAGDSEALSHYKKAMSATEQLFSNKLNDFEKAVYQRKLGEIYFRRGEHDKALVSFKQAFSLLGISYPFGKWQTRFAILNQLIKQIIKRFFHIFNKKMTITKLKNHEEEVCKIFESMAWVDFFINLERLAFDVISLLNYAEKIGYLHRTVQGYSAMGFLFDSMGFPFVARKYHNLSMRGIKSIDDELITASIYLFWGCHLDFQGKWKEALVSYKKSAKQFKNIGHLKKWGNSKMMIAFVLNYQGQFSQSHEICLHIAQIGLESGDHQLRGQGLHGIGLNQLSIGSLDDAILNIKESIKLLKSIPDYYALGMAYTDLARYYLNKNDLEAALSILKKNKKIIAQKGLQGFMVSLFHNALAETYLNIFEQSAEKHENISIGKVKKHVLKTINHAKHFKCGLPKAFRLNGLFCWIKGDHKKAHKFWKKAISISQEIGCRHEEGIIYFDMGKQIQDIKYLKKAQDIFVETGAKLDLRYVRKVIEKLE